MDADVPVAAGQVYTFQIETIGTVLAGANSTNPYPGGRSLIDEQIDHLVRTFVQIPEYPALSVDPMLAPETIDQSQQIRNSNRFTTRGYYGQSFTVGSSGELTRIGFNIQSVRDPETETNVTESTAVLRVFENSIDGVRPIGPRIHSQEIALTGGLGSFLLDPPIQVNAGEVYTFKVGTIGNVAHPFANNDPYEGSRALDYSGYDLLFDTYVTPISGQIPSWATFVDNGNGTGTLSGDPGRSGIGNAEVSIRASHGPDTAEQRFWLSILDGNEPPVASYGVGIWWEGREKTFDGSYLYDPDGTIVSYEWDFGDGTTALGVSPTHTYQDDGTYRLSLTVTDDLGVTDTNLVLFDIWNVPPGLRWRLMNLSAKATSSPPGQ